MKPPYKSKDIPVVVITGLILLAIPVVVFFANQQRNINSNAAADVTVTVDPSTTEMVSALSTGITHMQYSLDSWGNAQAVQRGKDLLRNGVKYQNQHIIGFGADDINPSAGVYQWGSLDARIQIARDSGNEPVITLCCAPGWMKASGSTWQDIAEAPTVANHQNYANLAAEVAKRYPDVKYFQVWNEMKGMWNNNLNRWDYERYTDLYNKIWTSVKAVRPDAKLGGPYASLGGGSIPVAQYATAPIAQGEQAVIDYWFANKLGADFIIVDGWVGRYHDEADWTQNPNMAALGWNEAELLNRTAWFGAVTKKLKTYNLPVWWAEDYFVYSTNDEFEAVGLASMLYHELKNGAAVTLRWKPQATDVNNQNFFTDTRVLNGGQPFTNYNVYKDFHTFFGPGTQIVKATSSDPKILVLASPNKTMLINQHNTQKIVSVNGVQATLNPYQVQVINTPPLKYGVFEAEHGIVAGSVSEVTNANASGGKYVLFGSVLNPQPVGQTGQWTLAFADEFNGSNLDTTKWYANRWFAATCAKGADNTELQYYTKRPENVSVSGGALHLRALKTDYTCNESTWGGTKQYSSGWVQTGGAASSDGARIPPGFTMGLGYVEAKVKLPAGKGLWPAVWMLATNNFQFPSRPEIDNLEILGDTPSTWRFHVHFTDAGGAAIDQGSNYAGPNSSTDWHTIGLWRKADRLEWYVDGIPAWTYTGAAIPQESVKMYIILNLAVGGNWPGAPDANTVFPADMQVDYVRAWQ